MIQPMRAISYGALAWSLLLALASEADVRRRWYVDFELGVPREVIVLPRKDPTKEAPTDRMYIKNKPEMFQYQDRLGKTTLVWFVAFTLKNPSDAYVPIVVDLILRTDQGKDFHQDIVRTDPSIPPRGKVCPSVLNDPDIELKVVSAIEKLGNRNEELRRERLMELKRENRYLNPAELRRKSVLNPGEEVVGLAIFRDVDRHTNSFDLMVGGLADVARVSKVERDRVHYVYENRVLHFYFDFPGDEFERIVDFVSVGHPKSKKWEIRQVGPACDKEALPRLIDAMAMEDPVLDESIRKLLPTVRYGREIRQGAYEALKKFTGLSYAFDAGKPPSEPGNLDAIRSFREWWTRNSEKLVYNEILNQFEIKPQVIPGAVEVKPPYAR